MISFIPLTKKEFKIKKKPVDTIINAEMKKSLNSNQNQEVTK